MVMISAWWTTRSMSAVAVAAFGKMLGHSLKGKFVVRTRLTAFVAPADDLEEEVGGPRVVGEIPDLINHEEPARG